MYNVIITTARETEFLMNSPEEFDDLSPEKEKVWLRELKAAPNFLMIVCFVEETMAGYSQISFRTGMKDRHRASVAIVLLKEFWGLGIGTKMLEEMTELPKDEMMYVKLNLNVLREITERETYTRKWGFVSRGYILTRSG